MIELKQGWMGAGIPRTWRMRVDKKGQVHLEFSVDKGFNWMSQLACSTEPGSTVAWTFVGPLDVQAEDELPQQKAGPTP